MILALEGLAYQDAKYSLSYFMTFWLYRTITGLTRTPSDYFTVRNAIPCFSFLYFAFSSEALNCSLDRVESRGVARRSRKRCRRFIRADPILVVIAGERPASPQRHNGIWRSPLEWPDKTWVTPRPALSPYQGDHVSPLGARIRRVFRCRNFESRIFIIFYGVILMCSVLWLTYSFLGNRTFWRKIFVAFPVDWNVVTLPLGLWFAL